MKQKFRAVVSIGYALTALFVSVGFTALPTFLNHAAAAAQVQTRSIEMSSAAASAASVTYTISFNPATSLASGSTHGIIVDICDNDPLIGDGSCTYPAGFDWGGATPTLTGMTNMGSSPDWVAAGTQGGAGAGKSQTLSLTSTTTGSLTHNSQASFNITTVTNPSTANHTFYARILTFDTAAHLSTEYLGGSYSGTTRNTSFADEVDYGGVAMSTSSTIQITANVMEQITFCVSGPSGGSDPISANCTGAVAPSFTLGHGSPTAVLDNNTIDTSPVYSLLSTNASQGAVVRMKAGNTCTNLAAHFTGGLSSGNGSSCAIEGVDSNGTATAITAGAPAGNPGGAFGLCVKAGSANTVAVAPYDNAGGVTACDSATNLSDNSGNGFGSLTTNFGMEDAVTSTYGSTLLNTASLPVNAEKDTYVFAGTAASTTPAAIYTGSESLIATGTF